MPLQTVTDGPPHPALEASVLELATSFLARLSALLAPSAAPEPIAIPVRRDGWQAPRRAGRRH